MKIYLDSVGCRLNQSEIEHMAGQFLDAGHVLLDDPAGADLVVLNSCTVTSAAASDSRQKIRQAVKAGAHQVVVTGCWATLDPVEAASIPGVSAIVNNEQKPELVRLVIGDTHKKPPDIPGVRHLLPGTHRKTRAFIKVQEGCDDSCTYCVTRIARGRSRSVPQAQVFGSIHAAELGDGLEVVLTGVHLGSWGMDLDPPSNLHDLVISILSNSSIPRLRFSSLEPWDLNETFFNLWRNTRICRHLHLPLQSGSKSVLQRMARRTTPEDYEVIVRMARNACPEMAVTTDMIVGFPGETENEFEESLEFIRRMNFAGGHVFTYSPRVGTPAATFPGRVPRAIARLRSLQMRQVLEVSADKYHRHFLGSVWTVLWETAQPRPQGGWILSGLTDNYLKVMATSEVDLWNHLSTVELQSLEGQVFRGMIIKEN